LSANGAAEFVGDVDRMFDNRDGICLNLRPDEISVAA
jgi:hypothetical protein